MRLTLLTVVFACFASALAFIALPIEESVSARDSLEDDLLIRGDGDVGARHSLEERKGKGGGDDGDDGDDGGDSISDAVSDAISALIAGIAADKAARNQFTSSLIGQAALVRYPQYNWVVCHTKHSIQFDGVQGTDWGQQHYEFDIKIGGTIGYEVYWFTSGNFTLEGKGGTDNLAWYGNIKSTSIDGKSLVFENRNNPLPPPNGAPSSMPMVKRIYHAVPIVFIIYFCLY